MPITEEQKLRIAEIAKRINSTSNADFVKRLLDSKRKVIHNPDGTVSTHELGYVTEGDHAVVFPNIQSTRTGLVRFPYPESYERAVEQGDTVHMSVPDAELFTKNYKEFYPKFEYKKGGKIHIKPENRGKFTELKKRTGHSATWFKEHGTPAQKKMATFALNAKHWNHADGGFINEFGIGGPPDMINPIVVGKAIKQGILSMIPAKVSKGIASVVDMTRGDLRGNPDIKSYYDYGVHEEWDPGNGFLMSPSKQQKYMESIGYHKVDDGNYGMVNKAVTNLSSKLGQSIPIYQLGDDDINPEEVELVSTDPSIVNQYLRKVSTQRMLRNAGNYPSALYKSKNGNDYYVKSWDLGDYGQHGKKTSGQRYGSKQILAELYDYIGTPFVQRTGLIRVPTEEEVEAGFADGGPMSRGFLTPDALPTLLQQFTPNRQTVDYPQVESLNLPEQYVPEPAVIRTPIVDLSKYETAPEVVVPYTPEASAEIIANQEYDSMLDNILNRQRYAESGFNDRAVNKSSGATGAYQIMPIAYKDYLQRGHGKEGDLMNASYNRLVRDHVVKMVPRDLGSEFYSPADTAVNRHAKEMAVFNAGAVPVKRALRKAKAAGVDIVNTTDWIKYLPSKETRDYVNFVVLDQDIAGTGKNAEAYNRAYSRFQNRRDLGGMVERMKSLYNNDRQAMLNAVSRSNLNKKIK